ncbi:hypothetical protein ACWEO1_36250 [Kitasatospora cineracea]
MTGTRIAKATAVLTLSLGALLLAPIVASADTISTATSLPSPSATGDTYGWGG